MGRAYSDDLRRKLLEAHAAGKGTLRELAERFGVSVPWAWKVSAAHKRSGAVERAPQSRHGRPSRVDRAQVANSPCCSESYSGCTLAVSPVTSTNSP